MLGPVIGTNPFVPGGHILVEACVLELIDGYRQRAVDACEAGGILLGYRRGPHLHIVEATAPGPHDQRSRYHFGRSSEPHQAIARERWCQSGGRTDYLGEWHTHPEAKPSPSQLDLSEWRLIHRRSKLPMLFLIAGTETADCYLVGKLERLEPSEMCPA